MRTRHPNFTCISASLSNTAKSSAVSFVGTRPLRKSTFESIVKQYLFILATNRRVDMHHFCSVAIAQDTRDPRLPQLQKFSRLTLCLRRPRLSKTADPISGVTRPACSNLPRSSTRILPKTTSCSARMDVMFVADSEPQGSPNTLYIGPVSDKKVHVQAAHRFRR